MKVYLKSLKIKYLKISLYVLSGIMMIWAPSIQAQTPRDQAQSNSPRESSYENRLNQMAGQRVDQSLGTVSGRDSKEMRKRELYESYTYVPKKGEAEGQEQSSQGEQGAYDPSGPQGDTSMPGGDYRNAEGSSGTVVGPAGERTMVNNEDDPSLRVDTSKKLPDGGGVVTRYERTGMPILTKGADGSIVDVTTGKKVGTQATTDTSTDTSNEGLVRVDTSKKLPDGGGELPHYTMDGLPIMMKGADGTVVGVTRQKSTGAQNATDTFMPGGDYRNAEGSSGFGWYGAATGYMAPATGAYNPAGPQGWSPNPGGQVGPMPAGSWAPTGTSGAWGNTMPGGDYRNAKGSSSGMTGWSANPGGQVGPMPTGSWAPTGTSGAWGPSAGNTAGFAQAYTSTTGMSGMGAVNPSTGQWEAARSPTGAAPTGVVGSYTPGSTMPSGGWGAATGGMAPTMGGMNMGGMAPAMGMYNPSGPQGWSATPGGQVGPMPTDTYMPGGDYRNAEGSSSPTPTPTPTQ